MSNAKGGVIDDLYAYRLGPDEYLLIINASRIEDDFAWLEKQLTGFDQSGRVSLRNASNELGAIAVQGPHVVEFINECFPGRSQGGTTVMKITDLKKNQLAKLQFEGNEIWVSRTGYTGEDGFEVVAAAGIIESG